MTSTLETAEGHTSPSNSNNRDDEVMFQRFKAFLAQAGNGVDGNVVEVPKRRRGPYKNKGTPLEHNDYLSSLRTLKSVRNKFEDALQKAQRIDKLIREPTPGLKEEHLQKLRQMRDELGDKFSFLNPLLQQQQQQSSSAASDTNQDGTSGSDSAGSGESEESGGGGQPDTTTSVDGDNSTNDTSGGTTADASSGDVTHTESGSGGDSAVDTRNSPAQVGSNKEIFPPDIYDYSVPGTARNDTAAAASTMDTSHDASPNTTARDSVESAPSIAPSKPVKRTATELDDVVNPPRHPLTQAKQSPTYHKLLRMAGY